MTDAQGADAWASCDDTFDTNGDLATWLMTFDEGREVVMTTWRNARAIAALPLLWNQTKADMAYLRRVLLEWFQTSLMSLLNSLSQKKDNMKRYIGIDVVQERCALCIGDGAGTTLSEAS